MGKVVAKEIRAEIVGKVQAGERVPTLAEQYGISTKTIYGWLRQNSGDEVVSVLEYNKLKRENEELKRLVGELTLNMHVQKKLK
jgi:transposase